MLTSTISTSIFANRLPPPSLADLVPRIHVSVFFIYSARGQGGEELSDLAPDEYERRVVGFFDTWLLAAGTVQSS